MEENLVALFNPVPSRLKFAGDLQETWYQMPLRYLDAVVGDDCHIEGTECTRHQDCSLLEEKSLRCVEKGYS